MMERDISDLDEGRQAFLAYFDSSRHSTVANWILRAIREQGAANPKAVLTQTLAFLADHYKRYQDHNALEAAETIVAHYNDALAFARYYLAWDAIPYDEKQRIKDARGQTYKIEKMAEKPPSAKQLAYIRSLGFDGPDPSTMAAASVLIEQLKARKYSAGRRGGR